MTRTGGTDGFNEEMGWLPGYEGGEAAGDGFDTAFYAEAASAREYAQRYGEDGQAQREKALKQLEGTGYEELVMQGLQAEQNSAYREKAAAFLESFMKGEYIPDVQLGELWQSAQAWNRQRTQAGNRQDTAVQTAGANTAREGLNPMPGTAYNESMPNAAEGLTVGESLTEGKDYAAAGEMLGEAGSRKYEDEIFDIEKVRSKLKTEPDTAFFWSGRTGGVGGANVAANIAKRKGGVTLETIIDSKKIVMPEWDFFNPSSMDAWNLASGVYAEQVSGEIRAVVGSELRLGNIWENIELPKLKSNPNVTKITTIDPKTGIEKIIFER